jgi:hypothetical protein
VVALNRENRRSWAGGKKNVQQEFVRSILLCQWAFLGYPSVLFLKVRVRVIARSFSRDRSNNGCLLHRSDLG